MPFGYLDSTYIDFPVGIDEQYLRGMTTRSGVSFPQIVQAVDSRLGALNSALDPLVASLITPTTEVFADTTTASAFLVEERGEYTLARPQMREGSANMLPIRGYDVALGFTEDGLESMSLARINVQLDSLFLGWKNLYRKEVLRRFFSDAEVRVAIKTAVTSPGFAGSGTGDNAFNAASYPDGSPIAGGYTHYYRAASAGLGAAIKTGRDQLKKWYSGPYDLIAPQAQIDAISAINPGDSVNGFVGVGSLLVRPGMGTAEAQVDGTMFAGVLFGDIRVHQPITDFSSANVGLYKTFGNLVAQNPLAWRYDELKGRNAIVRSRDLYPLANAVVKQDFGIGVNNRTAAVLISVAASGNYTPPTLS